MKKKKNGAIIGIYVRKVKPLPTIARSEEGKLLLGTERAMGRVKKATKCPLLTKDQSGSTNLNRKGQVGGMGAMEVFFKKGRMGTENRGKREYGGTA